MKRKILIGILMFSLIFSGCTTRNKGVDDFSVARSSDSISSEEIHYFDAEAVALASTSNKTASLRSEALRAYNIVNETREKNGLETLSWDVNLESTSDVRAMECSQSFSHTRPNNTPWYTVNSQIMGGENLAYGFKNASEVLAGWMDSPTHRENILFPDFTKMSISVYVTDDGTYYWSQEFGY